VALSGNLGFVPLDEVLRLLTRADQSGAVDVWGQDVRGRIFITRKGVGLATTSDDKELRRHLVNSGYVDEAALAGIDSGSSTLAPIAEKESSIVDLLREMTVESLYQMTSKGSSFEVTESATSPYASPRAFELEAVLEEARRRSQEWAEVQKVIDDLDAVIRMNRDLGEQDSVKIGRDAWRLLCEMGSGSSVRSIAERLGTTDFWTAKVAAGLSEQHLLVFAESIAEETWVAPIVEEGAAAVEVAEAEPEVQAEVEEPAAEVEQTGSEDSAEEPVEVAANESWWVEPEAEEGEDTPAAEAEADGEAEEAAAPATRDSRFGQFAAKVEAEEGHGVELGYQSTFADPTPAETGYEAPADLGAVEEDTEAFLEKVFSQLESNGQPEEEGHGLLRRRRLGSVLKEVTEDN
jgi:hypothetical protein